MRDTWTRFWDGWDRLGLWSQYGLAFVAALTLFWGALEILPLLAAGA